MRTYRINIHAQEIKLVSEFEAKNQVKKLLDAGIWWLELDTIEVKG
jgi:hypothetical protein